jgi:hypothetical protein
MQFVRTIVIDAIEFRPDNQAAVAEFLGVDFVSDPDTCLVDSSGRRVVDQAEPTYLRLTDPNGGIILVAHGEYVVRDDAGIITVLSAADFDAQFGQG